MKCQKLFSGENINLSSAEYALGVVKVNSVFTSYSRT